MQRPTWAGYPRDGALGHGVARFLGNRLVVGRVERLAQRVEFSKALLGQGRPQLIDRHAEAFSDRAAFGLALRRGEAEREGVEARQELFEQIRGGEFAEILAVALVTPLLILLIGLATQDGITEAGHVAFQFSDAGGGVRRRGFRSRSIGHGIIFG